jgi:hypothetical protein
MSDEESEAYKAFVAASLALKEAEAAFKAARQAYVDAVAAMSAAVTE